MTTKYASKQAEMSFSKELKYLLYVPEGYDSDRGRRWPLMVFLHEAGERGDDLELVKMHGPPKLIDAGKNLPFIVVSPQLALGEWWSPDMVAWLVNDTLRALRVDLDRVYLTGLSMGGYGTGRLLRSTLSSSLLLHQYADAETHRRRGSYATYQLGYSTALRTQ